MRNIVFYLLIFCSLVVSAQNVRENSIMLQAMRDELSRGLESLKLPGHPDAFYLFTEMNQMKNYRLRTSMGSLISEAESQNVFMGNLRVLCGSYDFNDESLNHRSERDMRIPAEFPEDTTDYLGIRRALWINMETIFLSASKGMKKNEELLKQKGQSIADVPHRSFAKMKPVRIVKSFVPEQPDKQKLIALMTKWSDSLSRISGITYSDMNFGFSTGYKYMYSTEGLVSRLPESQVVVSMAVDCKNASGVQTSQRIQLFGTSPSKLINEKVISEQFALLKKSASSIRQSKELEESYNGPVLFIGESVASAFLTAISDYQEPLSYSNDVEEDNGNMYVERRRIRQAKIGSVITHQDISVRLNPLLRDFEGTELFGSYLLDDEGVEPVPFTLIESGVVKGFRNDRTITDPNQAVNGYYRSLGGVVDVSVKNGSDVKTLRSKFLEEIKKQQLEFGIILQMQSGGLVTMSRLFAADGHEEALCPVRLPQVSMKSLKKLIAVSSKRVAVNLKPSTSDMSMEFYGSNLSQGITSFIVPDAMVVGEVDIRVAEYRRKAQPDFVPAPDLK